jgi:polysaccharide deacetylase 2 family uncharacterized protein YibQ
VVALPAYLSAAPRRFLHFFAGWPGLGRFWAGVLLVLGVGAVLIQVLAPPPPPSRSTAGSSPHREAIPKPRILAGAPLPAVARRDQPGRDTPGPISDPDPALQEPAPGSARDMLPRISADGRLPMQVYAAGFDRSSQRPRVGLLLAGIGLSEADTLAAIRNLPGSVTLAVSPYATSPEKLLSIARAGEHEYLLSLPMEPRGFPNNDPGPRALMTSLTPQQNLDRLTWLLARIGGYVGATGVLGQLRGERFTALSDELEPVLAELGGRGLLWVDSRSGQGGLPKVWSRSIDLVVDEPPIQADIDTKLEQLSKLAQDRGAALGLVTSPRPVAVERVAAWANGLANRGLVLAPVSALVQPPIEKGPTQ